MSAITTITDENIKNLVSLYLVDKSRLPADLVGQPIGAWDVSRVTNMSYLFSGMTFNEPLDTWNVSRVTNMAYMFDGCSEFNQPLHAWKKQVGRVTDMTGMFKGCSSFNQPLGAWNVSRVISMAAMFYGCKAFNQPLHTWNVTNVMDMEKMFMGCVAFNQPLGHWNVSSVISMGGMFSYCESFNQLLRDWNVVNVEEMDAMFYKCKSYNQPLPWYVGGVMYMDNMFEGCIAFNQPLNHWHVDNVEAMDGMFKDCIVFNQPLDRWNVSNVTDMNAMFMNCTAFNQDLSQWDVTNVEAYDNIFSNCPIVEGYQPHFDRRVRQRVDPYQIHKESAKINYDILNSFFVEKNGGQAATPANYAVYIQGTLQQFIAETGLPPDAVDSLENIMVQRLRHFNYQEMSEPVRTTLLNALAYVNLQPTEFKRAYVEAFLQDCTQAYEGQGAAAMTCAQGALERIVTSLVTAVQTMASTGNENPDWDNLVAIIVANPTKLIPQYIQDWYKMHKTGTENAFAPVTSADMRRADLRQFLLEKFPNEATLIDQQIAAVADSIGYEDDDFMYGGRRLARRSRARLCRRSQAVKASRKRGPAPNRKQRRRTVKRTKKPRKN